MSKLADLRKSLLERPSFGQSPSNLHSASEASVQDAPQIHSVDGGLDSSVNGGHRSVDDRLPPRQVGFDSKLAISVAKIVGSANAYQESWAKVAEWSDSIEQVTQWLEDGLEPMKALCDQLETLSSTFQPMHAFEQQLATMAKSFKPIEDLHEAVEDLMASFHGPLARLAGSLESASTSKRRIAELAKRFEAAGELQTRFHELSRAFAGDRERTSER